MPSTAPLANNHATFLRKYLKRHETLLIALNPQALSGTPIDAIRSRNGKLQFRLKFNGEWILGAPYTVFSPSFIRILP